MSKFQLTIAVCALVNSVLAPWHSAAAQQAQTARAPAEQRNAVDQKNTIVSGTTALPRADAAMQRASKEMAQAALNFWAALTPEQKAKSAFPFDDEERFNWHFIPRARKGITWNDMTPTQQKLAHAFLASGLSNRGFQQVETVTPPSSALFRTARTIAHKLRGDKRVIQDRAVFHARKSSTSGRNEPSSA